METQESLRALLLNYKSLEVLFTASLTVNICVAWTLVLPKICKVISKGFNRVHRSGEHGDDSSRVIPAYCRRFATNLIFIPAMPICGIILLTTTKVLHDPFFEYSTSICLVFSIALGHHVFKTAEVLTYRSRIIHDKPLLVHHLVATATFVSILVWEQNAIIGLVVLFAEGSLVFAEHEREPDHFRRVISLEQESRLRKVGTAVLFVIAVIVKGVIPLSLVAMAFLTSLSDLLKMEYAPLAFFFLSLVFFTAVDVWFFKDLFAEMTRQLSKFPRLPLLFVPVPRTTTKVDSDTTAINNEGLKSLMLAKNSLAGSVNITENVWKKDKKLNDETPPLRSNTPTDHNVQLFVDIDLGE